MTRDILAEEQLKLELRRVLSKYFLRQIEDLIRNQTGAFFPVEGIHSLELGQRLGRRKELQLMNITVVDSLQNRKFSLDLAFKFLQNADAAVEEGNGAVWLGEILKTNYKVHTSQLLYFSHSNSLLIYEGLKGTQEFFESPLDEPQKLFLAGLALPYIHGIFRQKVQVDRYLHLITNVLNGIPFNPDEKENLKSLFQPDLRKIGLSESGANCFGDYHPGNIMFKDSEYKTSNTGDIKIDHTEIFLIDPAYLDRSGNIDRGEDIGTFFAKFAYNDFIMSQSFDRCVSDFDLICKGYDHTISQNGVRLKEFYPEGTTFNFHIALGILIDTMFKIRSASISNPETRIRSTYEAVKNILTECPFDLS
ncbi:MAG: hypothetical protein EAX86_08595 [Candidatus Heimdallarchaeota archaeon]|nr:hypothetical protein [Candidatus Heimdallarchaeota archaeon]